MAVSTSNPLEDRPKNAVIETPSASLPAVAPTGFPMAYEAAKLAIQKCESPLECRTMADKAAAMRVYARMRDDKELHNRAVRLQAWADRRWGELDKELNPDRRQENLKQNQAPHRKAVERPIGETAPLTDGTTDYQRKISRRLAAIPEPEFIRQVEGERPPTVTQLAEQGKVTRGTAAPPSPWKGVECAETQVACDAIERFAKFCARTSPGGIARSVNAAEADALRQCIAVADQWLGQLAVSLAAES
jgi:hypothetical protein